MLLGALQPPNPHRAGPLRFFPGVSQQILLLGFGGRKALSSMGKISTTEVLRLRATSAVSRDQSVRRSAQDDDFVGVLTKNILDGLVLMGPCPRDPSYGLRTNRVFGI